jgi:hypothetical protein
MEIVLIKTAPIRSVVRCRSAAAGGVNAVCHTYNGGVSQVGHDVIASPQVVPVYWGDTVSNDAALKSTLDHFVRIALVALPSVVAATRRNHRIREPGSSEIRQRLNCASGMTQNIRFRAKSSAGWPARFLTVTDDV